MRTGSGSTLPCAVAAVFSAVAMTLLSVVFLTTGQAATTQPAFVHPGLLHNLAELEFVKTKIKAGAAPWKSSWESLRSHSISQLTWNPKATRDVLRGAYNNPDIGASDMERAAAAAYSQALQWYMTGEKAHAAKAIEILNAYSFALKSVTGHDARLLIGMTGINFLNAAELIRHTYPGWKESDQKQFERLLLTVLYPVIKDFYPDANGNWDAAMIQSMMAMAVFLDDRAIFDRAVDHYMNGRSNGAILHYVNDFGECQESGRDQSHTQMGLGFLGCACEIGWKQGADLYGAYNNRLAVGFEYTAKYNVGYEVPYEPYRSIDGKYNYLTISRIGRGRFRPIYERIYHHYHDRMGMEMPYATKVLDKIRPEGWAMQHAAWGTLMFANVPVFPKGYEPKNRAITSSDAFRGRSSGAQPVSEEPARRGKVVAKPLFRDPVFDGAADPVVCWNRAERKWFMFYTNRRANAPNTPGMSWVHGTRIGIAESVDGGATWKYRGTADIHYGEGDYSYWAPEIIDHDGTYHMFLTFVPGMHTDWSGTRDILHLTSTDLLKWKYEATLKLSSNRVIDACVMRLPNGTWRMWYNNETDHKSIYYADSRDLFTWEDRGKAIGDQPGEGPNVFGWKDRYWMVVDVWDGLGIYSSDDCQKWTRQAKNLLKAPGQGADDKVKGGHPDVVVSGDRAFLFYFTHPGRQNSAPADDGYERRRSSIQVVELEYENGEITCDRDKPTHILLQPVYDLSR